MRKAVPVLVIAVLGFFGTAANLPAPIVSHIYSYWSDYFVTQVGEEDYLCDDSYDSWGTLDGDYFRDDWYGCLGGGGHGSWCYQKVSGQWTQISCP